MSTPTSSPKSTNRLLLGIFIVGIALTAAAALWLPRIDNGRKAAIEECRALYAQARTLADTMRAEQFYPRRATIAGYRRILTCKDLREAALLGHRVGDTVAAPPAR